ncbi:sensor histidine kinase, partial [Streptomyces lunaelactis]|nr:sensor histidine kinase [Streptomyces lunaelactis]
LPVYTPSTDSAAAPRPVLEAQTETPVPPGVTSLRLRGAPPQTQDGELPRRVRQAHLVPQLREEPPAEEPDDPAADDHTPERTPEQVRDRMTAYRNGWTRGGGAAPGTAAPGSEGDEA